MKSLSNVVVGILLFAPLSLAQSAAPEKNTTEKKAATVEAAPVKAAAVSPKAAASSGPAVTTKSIAPDAAKRVAPERPKFSEKDKRGYTLGVSLGQEVAGQGLELNRDLLMQGIKDALSGGKFLMTTEEMNATLAVMQKAQHDQAAAAIKAYAEKNKHEGDAFLAANKSKDGVVTLASGLQYKILKAADGKKPGLDDKVVCNYRVTLLNGTEIDSSYKRNEASTIPLKGVLKGWTEALQLMPVGSRWQLFIPAALAYGERGDGRQIGPNETLVFEVELLSIRDKG